MRTDSISVDLPMQGHRLMRAGFDGGRMSSDGGALLLRAADRGHPLAGASTLNRLEMDTPEAPQDRYRHIVADLRWLDTLLVELFLDSHEAPRGEIVLDVDETNDPPHGRQERRFFHG